MISIIIPYIDQLDELGLSVKHIEKNTVGEYELILINNGSSEPFLTTFAKHVYNPENIGVLKTFKQGLENSQSNILVFIHSDVLIHELGWDIRLQQAMDEHKDVGVLGFFGAQGTGSNGGRIRSMSNMQGKIWGKCECHDLAAHHHSELRTDFSYAGGLDGLSMIFRRQCLQDLVDKTDIFEDWRAIFHFYDRIIPCKVMDLGWKIGFLGIAFDHMSGATACRSDIYRQTAVKWLEKRGYPISDNPDHDMYLLSERQFFAEFGNRLGVIADEKGNLTWNI